MVSVNASMSTSIMKGQYGYFKIARNCKLQKEKK